MWGQWIDCRPGCGACCEFISISSSIPGHPNGKPAGVRCVNLDSERRCILWGTPEFPKICKNFKAEKIICGNTYEIAVCSIKQLEELTK